MAKKKAARGDFVMSAEIRNLLKEDRSLKGREVVELLKKKFPGQKINENSANVAFSNARKQLGITGDSGSGKKGRGGKDLGDFSDLQAAREFVEKVGDPQAAIDAVKMLEKLQVGQ